MAGPALGGGPAAESIEGPKSTPASDPPTMVAREAKACINCPRFLFPGVVSSSERWRRSRATLRGHSRTNRWLGGVGGLTRQDGAFRRPTELLLRKPIETCEPSRVESSRVESSQTEPCPFLWQELANKKEMVSTSQERMGQAGLLDLTLESVCGCVTCFFQA